MSTKLGKLSTKEQQFYAGSMVLALGYLHKMMVIYRDLKPENMLLDQKGYLKIIDFGCSKKMKTLRTFTCIGTPHFMSPDFKTPFTARDLSKTTTWLGCFFFTELIQGKGHSYKVDCFALGVVLHELFLGYLPFGRNQKTRQGVWYEILRKKLRFPADCENKLSPEKNLLMGLLEKQPERRLSIQKVKVHQWFKDFDFPSLLLRGLPAPYVPPEEAFSMNVEVASENLNDGLENTLETSVVIRLKNHDMVVDFFE